MGLLFYLFIYLFIYFPRVRISLMICKLSKSPWTAFLHYTSPLHISYQLCEKISTTSRRAQSLEEKRLFFPFVFFFSIYSVSHSIIYGMCKQNPYMSRVLVEGSDFNLASRINMQIYGNRYYFHITSESMWVNCSGLNS